MEREKTDFKKVFNAGYALEKLSKINSKKHRLELDNYKKLGEREACLSPRILNQKFTY